MALQNVNDQLEIAGSPDSTFDQKLVALNTAFKEVAANLTGGASRAQCVEDLSGLSSHVFTLLKAWQPAVDPVAEKEKAAQTTEKTLQERMADNVAARQAAKPAVA